MPHAADPTSGSSRTGPLTGLVTGSLALGLLTACLAVPVLGVVTTSLRAADEALDQLPRVLRMQPLPERTELTDRHGRVIAYLYEQNRVSVPLRAVARPMVRALLAVEDARFYEHGGMDLRGTLRALVHNSTGAGALHGGSSVTQQLVKQTLVLQARTAAQRRAATEDSYARKLRELRHAVALERRHSKDWILERYLNTVYFGNGAYGVQAAAERYFSTTAAGLSTGQAALLAGLVRNPVGYDPLDSPRAAKVRRNLVLSRMAEVGALSSARARHLRRAPLGLEPTTVPNGCLSSAVPEFCRLTWSYLARLPALGRTLEAREALLREGGLRIRTTLDTRMQSSATAAVRSHVAPEDDAIGAVAMVEPGTGAVRALAQSRPMGAQPGETFVSFAASERYGGASGFQAGSTFKVFVLAAALRQGIPLSRSYLSPPTLSISEAEFEDCDGAPYGYGTWELSNSTTSGRKDLVTGTRESVNTFYAQLAADTGLCEPFRLARRLGVDLDNPAGAGAERTPSFTLGTANVSPLELAEAYGTFAARGLHCDSRPVTTLADREGTEVLSLPPTCQQALEPGIADTINVVLRGVLEGGYAPDEALGQPAAGKTGNSEGLSVWFVGYTPDLATAAMVAGAAPSGAPVSLNGQVIGGSYVAEATGSGLAAPVWGDAMAPLAPLLPDTPFVAPGASPRLPDPRT